MSRERKGTPNRARRIWRGLFFATLIWILLLLALVGWCNWIGLPNFLLAPLRSKARAAGYQWRCERAVMHGFRNVVLDAVEFIPISPAANPHIHLDQARLRWSAARLSRQTLPFEWLETDGATVLWPATNAVPAVALEFPRASLRFGPHDRIELAQFRGRYGGAEIRATGRVDHAFAFARKKGAAPSRPVTWPKQLREQLAKIHFEKGTKTELQITGDARDPATFTVNFSLVTPQATSVHESAKNLSIRAALAPAAGSKLQGDWSLRCDLASWTGGLCTNLHAAGTISVGATNGLLEQVAFEARADRLKTEPVELEQSIVTGKVARVSIQLATWRTQFQLRAASVSGEWGSVRTNAISVDARHRFAAAYPRELKWTWSSSEATTIWGTNGPFYLSGTARPARPRAPRAGSAWGVWQKIAPLELDWELKSGSFQSPKLSLETVACAGRWRAPWMQLSKLSVAMYGGHLNTAVQLDIDSRELQAECETDFDIQKISPLLTKNAAAWLRQLGFDEPPKTRASIGMILPPWTSHSPDWEGAVAPTIRMAGEFQTTGASFRKMPFSSTQSHFTMTNFIWRLPDLTLFRPEGQAQLDYAWHIRTQDFYWKIDSGLDLKILRPILDPPERKILDDFEFSDPAHVTGEIWGRWHKPEEVGFRGHVDLKNFHYRKEPCDSLETALSYTNLLLELGDVHLEHEKQKISADGALIDFPSETASVTNVVSTFDPQRVARLIGPRVQKEIAHYRFGQPPSIRLNGRLQVGRKGVADAQFEVAGNDFRFRKLHASHISGNLFWRGETLAITNVHASFYKGQLEWSGWFDFAPRIGTDFRFEGTVEKADLHEFMTDITGPTNRFQGSLDGTLAITQANSEDIHSWNGHGQTRLRNGFLWDIPLLGFLTPVIDKISTGIANSPIHDGAATFKIRNSVIQTKDLELRSPAMRLHYDGKIEFSGGVDARLEAQILRDVFVVGPLFSAVLWPLSKAFEYKVTGTLNRPIAEPVYIPKILFMPFHPFRTLEKLGGGEK